MYSPVGSRHHGGTLRKVWSQSVDFVSSFSHFSEVSTNIRSLMLMSFGKSPSLNIWFGCADLWFHHQTTVWVIRSPTDDTWPSSGPTVHQLMLGTTVRWATRPPHWMLSASWETSSCNFTASNNYTLLFMSSFCEKKNRDAKLYNSYLFQMRLWDIQAHL